MTALIFVAIVILFILGFSIYDWYQENKTITIIIPNNSFKVDDIIASNVKTGELLRVVKVDGDKVKLKCFKV